MKMILKEQVRLRTHSASVSLKSYPQHQICCRFCSSHLLLDVFDLVLNDGETQTKCVLAPKLYDPYITKRLLVSMPVIEVTDWEVRKDEATINAPQFCIISGLRIVQGETAGTIAWTDEEGHIVSPVWYLCAPAVLDCHLFPRNDYNIDPKLAGCPLLGARGFYWTLMSDDTPYDSRWDILCNSGRKEKEAVKGTDWKDESGKPFPFRYHEELGTVFHVSEFRFFSQYD